MDGLEGWMDGRMIEKKDGWINGLMDGWMDEWRDEKMDG